MAEHVFSVLCEGSSVDQETGNVSLFKVMERKNLTSEEQFVGIERQREEHGEVLIALPMQIISWFVRSDPDKGESTMARFSITAPGGKTVRSFGSTGQLEQIIDLEKHYGRRFRLDFAAFPYRGIGRYWFVVEMKRKDRWMKVARMPFIFELSPSIEPVQPS